MPDKVLPRRLLLLASLTVALAAFTITHCKTTNYGQPPRETRCVRGNYSASRPIICVDERTLTADPDPAKLFDVEVDNGQRSNRPVTIHWFTQRTGDLNIQFADNSCVEDLKCDTPGHCSARVLPLNANQPRRCKYTIWIGKEKRDPELFIVNPCCW